jgi:hypothetical protein
MDKQQIANLQPQKAPYLKPTIRALDVSELPEEWVNALRNSAQLPVPEEIDRRQSKTKAAGAKQD